MDITQTQLGAVAVIRAQGALDALTAPELSRYLEGQLAAGQARLVMDLSALDYLSSAGLRVLLEGVKSARRQNGDLRLAAAQTGVRKVLEMSGFTSILQVFADVEAAAASFPA